jgi:hypothetical protein
MRHYATTYDLIVGLSFIPLSKLRKLSPSLGHRFEQPSGLVIGCRLGSGIGGLSSTEICLSRFHLGHLAACLFESAFDFLRQKVPQLAIVGSCFSLLPYFHCVHVGETSYDRLRSADRCPTQKCVLRV